MLVATKKQIILPIIFIAAGIFALGALKSMKKPPEKKKQEVKIPLVAVDYVEMAPLQLTIESQGVVTARYETRLVAQVGGEIVELSEQFVRGGFVKKGQLLARIDPNDYEAALIEAEANLAQAAAALELEIAQGRVAEEEWKNISSAEPSELGLRRPQLKQEQARVKAAEAAVKRAKRNLERTAINAPYDALIGSREIGLGSFVGTGSDIGRLMSTAVADIRLPVAANQMQYLSNGGIAATVSLQGEIAGKTVHWPAKVVRSEGVVDAKSRMTYLVAQVEQPYGQNSGLPALRFGTYVSATIDGITLPAATMVSRHLIDNDRLPTLDSDSRLHFKKVNIIREHGSKAVITEGLVSGDRIVTTALSYPAEGVKLALKGETDNDNQNDVAESQMAMKKE